jgi:hypothetical protein
MSSWLKAGLVGGVVLVVLDLLGLIPCVGLVACLLNPLAYIGVGVLAAYWMSPVRTAGDAAGQGALAGVVAALIGGVVNTVILFAEVAIMGSGQILSQIPPETLRQLEQAGMDPGMIDSFAGPLGATLGGSICCLAGLILAAILGAIGGAVFAAIRPD